MKRFAITVYVLGVAIAAAGLPAAAADQAKSVCLRSYEIDHTETPDDSSLIFHMRNHKVWRAALINKCVGLRTSTRGFTYEPTNPGTDEICSNLLTIRVNDTGEVCLVGAITPVEPAPKPAQ